MKWESWTKSEWEMRLQGGWICLWRFDRWLAVNTSRYVTFRTVSSEYLRGMVMVRSEWRRWIHERGIIDDFNPQGILHLKLASLFTSSGRHSFVSSLKPFSLSPSNHLIAEASASNHQQSKSRIIAIILIVGSFYYLSFFMRYSGRA